MAKCRRRWFLLKLLLWKNWRFRRHYLWATILELLLPSLAFLIFALYLYIGDKSISEGLQNSLKTTIGQLAPPSAARQIQSHCYLEPTAKDCPRCTVSKVCPEESLVEYLREVGKKEIAYAPNNAITTKILQRVISKYNLAGWNITPLNDEYELELMNIRTYSFRQAVVFGNGFKEGTFPSSKKLAYKLRFVNMAHNFYELNHEWSGDESFERIELLSENEAIIGGYSAMQVMLDKAITEIVIESKGGQNVSLKETVAIVRTFPQGPVDNHKNSAFENGFQDLLDLITTIYATLFALTYTPLIPIAIVGIVSEKQFGAKELTNMMGMTNTLYMFAWLVDSFVMSLISSAIVTFLLFLPFAPARNQLISAGSPIIVFIVILIFALAARCWSFLFAAPFRNPVFPAVSGMAVWLLLFLSVAWSDRYTGLAPLNRDIVMSVVLPALGLRFIFRIFIILAVEPPTDYEELFKNENFGYGIQLKNLANKYPGPILAPLFNDNEGMSVIHVLLLMILGSILYCLFGLYIENVFPSSVAVSKPWYFPIKSLVKCLKSRRRKIRKPKDIGSENPKLNYTPSSMSNLNLFPVVEITNVTKRFGKHVAVDNMCCSILEKQITCLLGHNGAGKTTTMSMITGYLTPTTGKIDVLGADANTETEKAREYMSLCPQFSIYFSFLTVEEHFIFFSKLREDPKPREKAKEMMQAVDLSAKGNTLAGQLSGGQQRKLSLGLALIGDVEITILDEPTTGIDPESRRFIWNLLLAQRSTRAILLSTHFMEEAEALADTIIIMYNGRVVSWGSPAYLKRAYAPEYVLSFTLTKPESSDLILESVRSTVPSLLRTESEIVAQATMPLSVPNTPAHRPELIALFRMLEENKEQWGIEEIGVSVTTIDDVFTRVRDEERRKEGKKRYSSFACAGDEVSFVPLTGSKLLASRIRGLFYKRLLYLRTHWYLILAQIFLVITPTLVYVYVESISSRDQVRPHEPLVAPNLTSDAISPYASIFADEDITKEYKKFVGKSAIMVQLDSNLTSRIPMCPVDLRAPDILSKLIQNYFLKYRLKEGHTKYSRVHIAGVFVCKNLTAVFSGYHKHSITVSVNAVTNALLSKYAPGYTIQVVNQPLRRSVHQVQDGVNFVEETVGGILFGTLLTFGLSLALAVFYVIPAQEKQDGVKQMQTMTGLNPILYWSSFFVLDFIIAICLSIVLTSVFPLRLSDNIYTSRGGFGVLLLISIVYSYSALTFGYVFTLMTSSASSGFIFLCALHIVTGVILGFVVRIIQIFSPALTLVFKIFLRVFPSFGLLQALAQFAENAIARDSCSYVGRDDFACKLLATFKKNSLYYKRCCDKRGAIRDLTLQVYLNSDYKGSQVTANVGQEVLWLFLCGLGYHLLLFALELFLLPMWRRHRNARTCLLDTKDDAVLAEAERVDGLVKNSKGHEGIVVQHLGKSFKNRSVVKSVSFAVEKGECFGFLGVNGAGKTTTYRMLTGELKIDQGNVWIDGICIQQNERECLSKIGYCPQDNAIISLFTGRQMLELMARLRGVSKVPGTVDLWLHLLGLKRSEHARCGNYSGGMKRLLNAGMAMIGNPPVTFLDEPTSGVDPVSRRRFWDVLREAQAMGTTIILTSHSMDECEALCSRVCILVNGELQCLGSTDVLKHKYAPGVKLMIKLNPETITPESRDVVVQCVREAWPDSSVKYENNTLLQYALLSDGSPNWESIFTAAEQLYDKCAEVIEDYSLSDNSLEDVLLRFGTRKTY